jgi:hypothetical protein
MPQQRSYYGPLFWLAAVSFAVPVMVALKAIDAAPGPYVEPEPNPDVSGVDHGLWDYLLKTYVADGLVDYAGIGRNHLFQKYLRQLGYAEPDKLESDPHRLALFCNAYNAFVINGVVTHKIAETVNSFDVEGVGFFDLKEHILAGETISLNDLEHKRIRPVFNEPRIHMALVCAARSCPIIRTEAYTGEQLDRQLEDQARLFTNSPKHVRYDDETNVLHLSKILRWYGKDFRPGGGYLAFLEQRADDADLKAALEAAQRKEVDVVFNAYNWDLNSQQAGRSGGGKKSVDFGSGSIPNE